MPEIACPTLIVWGASDRLINVRDADVFAELIPGSRKVVFADTGHVSMLERPDEFNALLAEFLASSALESDGAFRGAADELGVLADRHVDVLVGARRLLVGGHALGDLLI